MNFWLFVIVVYMIMLVGVVVIVGWVWLFMCDVECVVD